MSTTTTRMGLVKPAAGEDVDVDAHLNVNWDKIDANLGFASCTSTTRPTTVWAGLCIYETNTGLTYVSNGTAPASASWINIPNAGTATAVNIVGTAATSDNLTATVSGDANKRFILNADGKMEWGGGVSTQDVNLYRSSSTVLKTDDILEAVGGFQTATGAINITAAAATTTDIFSSTITGEGSNKRYILNADGTMEWGGGSGATDVTLYRSAVNGLRTNGSLTVDQNFTATGIGNVQFARMTSAQSRNATTVFANVTQLVLPIAANATYELTGYLIHVTATSNTPDMKFTWTFPASVSMYWGVSGPYTGATATNADGFYGSVSTSTSGSGTIAVSCQTTAMGSGLFGTVITGGTSGNLQLQFAQNTSTGENTSLNTGSYICLRRVA